MLILGKKNIGNEENEKLYSCIHDFLACIPTYMNVYLYMYVVMYVLYVHIYFIGLLYL